MRKNGRVMSKNGLTRKQFVIGVTSAVGILAAGKLIQVVIHNNKASSIKGNILGAASKVGHRLRSGDFPASSSTEYKKTVIVGGGVSGLSAARWLERNGHTSICLLELADTVGGNAVGGKNKISAYPWGAHYLPVPDIRNKELMAFLEECESITGYDEKGLPIYNEYHLCSDPEERVFFQGVWQDGLVPHIGVSAEDKAQINSFFQLMEGYRALQNKEGKDAFTLPLRNSYFDDEAKRLDSISFMSFLKERKYTAEVLLHYLNYCCKDDYGSTLEDTSAWAGIHYFASRKGKGSNAEYGDVLTWPEGNNFLIQKMDAQLKAERQLNQLVYSVTIENEKVHLLCFDALKGTTKTIIADQVILATPQYINQRILSANLRKPFKGDAFQYSPWMVANITLREMPAGRGVPLSWDNVIFNSESLGYVNACHQHLNAYEKQKVITYYLPITDESPSAARKKIYERTHQDWVGIILKDLKPVHNNIEQAIEQIDIWIWGHGMIMPQVGFISGEERHEAAQSIENKIFFAHTDLSGISVFEEGFYQGISAAKKLLN